MLQESVQLCFFQDLVTKVSKGGAVDGLELAQDDSVRESLPSPKYGVGREARDCHGKG